MNFNQVTLAEFIDTLESGEVQALHGIAERLLEDESVLTSGVAPVDFPETVPEQVKLMREKAECLKWAKADFAWAILIPELVGMVLQVTHEYDE